MSFANIAKAVAPIASRIGDEVVEGLGMASKPTATAAKTVDDWGWKGGKPGEITGGKYVKKEDEAFVNSNKEVRSNFPDLEDNYSAKQEKIEELYDKAMSSVNNKVQKQLLSGGIITENYYPSFRGIMKEFNALEEADIPREWTGKVLKALKNSSVRMHNTVLYDRGGAGNAVELSNFMRGLTNPEREVFLTVIPKTNSLEKAINVFPSILPLTKSQRETFLALLPEWYGSFDELAEAAKLLT